MDVRLKRLAFATLVLGAAVLPLVRQEAPPDAMTRPAAPDRYSELVARLRAARARWSAATERDSAAALFADGRARRLPALTLRGFPPAARSAKLDTTLTDLVEAAGSLDAAVDVAAIVYNQAGYASGSAWSGAYSGATIARVNGRMRCAALVPGELRPDGQVAVYGEGFAQAVAPCLLLAAFGRPGPAMAAWLEASRYAAARSSAWLTRSREFVDGRGQPPWGGIYDPTWAEAWDEMHSRGLWSLGAGTLVSALMPPYQLGAPALRCITGEAAACERGVLDSSLVAERTRGVPGDLTLSWWLASSVSATVLAPRPVAHWYLSDLIRDGGRVRFARFWKSDRPLVAAFREAYGEELGSWTARWARRQWLASWEAKYRSPDVILGASLARSWPLLVLGWSALALGLAAWTAGRRQVS